MHVVNILHTWKWFQSAFSLLYPRTLITIIASHSNQFESYSTHVLDDGRWILGLCEIISILLVKFVCIK